MEEEAEEATRTSGFETVNKRNFIKVTSLHFIKIGSKEDWKGKDNFALGHPGLVFMLTWRRLPGLNIKLSP